MTGWEGGGREMEERERESTKETMKPKERREDESERDTEVL